MLGNTKVVIAGVFGNALEWYDFTTYAFFAYIFTTLFFPTENEFASLLLTFTVFALGFLIRPLGGFLFGYLGDRFGRIKALVVSIIMMSVPTFLLGFLPDYQHIGIFAPVLLTILRLVQGMAVSGELTSATTYLVEHAGENQRGLAGSLAMGAAILGIAISSAVTTLITESTTQTQLYAWGWRLPFILGGLLGVVGLIVRLRSEETAHFKQLKETGQNALAPQLIKALFTEGKKPILLAIMLTCVMAVANYYLIAYFNTYLIKYAHLPNKGVALINFIAIAIFTILIPICGIASDKFGRKPIFACGVIGMCILIWPIFMLLTAGTLLSAAIAQLLFVLALAPIAALIPTTLAEMFTARIRNTGLALSYNISLALFGGTAPLVAISLVQATGQQTTPAWYLLASAIISLLAWWLLKETYREPLG